MILFHARSNRVGFTLLGTLLLVLFLPCGGPAAADEDPPARAQDSASKQRVPGETGKAIQGKQTEKELASRAFPRGITVLVEDWKNPKSAKDYPLGVTVLSPIPAVNSFRPVIRVLVPLPQDEGAKDEGSPESEKLPPEGQDLLRAPAEVLRERAAEETRKRAESGDEAPEPPRDSFGPSLREQIQNLPGTPHPGGDPASPGSSWTPVDAWPERDEANPYPWNPAEFSRRTFDLQWKPRSSLARRDPETPYPWNPSSFSKHIFDPVWRPSDSWGRTLEAREEPEAVNAAAAPDDAADMTKRRGKKTTRPRRKTGRIAPDPAESDAETNTGEDVTSGDRSEK